MEMSTTVTITGMIVTFVLSIGTSFVLGVIYISRFVGKTESQRSTTEADIKSIKDSIKTIEEKKANITDINEIKSELRDIFQLIRDGSLHPVCLQLEQVGALKNQATNNCERISRLEDDFRLLRNEMKENHNN